MYLAANSFSEFQPRRSGIPRRTSRTHLSTVPFIVTMPAKKVAKGAAQGQGSQPQSVEVDQEQLCTKVEMLMISPEANKSFDPVKGSISPFWAARRLSRASQEASVMEILK